MPCYAVKDMFAFLMDKKHVIRFVALLLVVSGVVVLVALPLRAPRYLGRTWESWLGDLEQWDGDTNNPAFCGLSRNGNESDPSTPEGPPIGWAQAAKNNHGI